MTLDAKPNRATARRETTRRTLICAAAGLLSEGRMNATIQEITDHADVGVGTFYNHFRSREELYAATVTAALEVVEEHTTAVQDASSGDPAERVAIGIRCYGRIPDAFPFETSILMAAGPFLPVGPAVSERFREDVEAGLAAGRFRCDDPELVMLLIAGGMNRIVATRGVDPTIGPDRIDGAAAVALRMLGVDAAEADEITRRPLPEPAAT